MVVCRVHSREHSVIFALLLLPRCLFWGCLLLFFPCDPSVSVQSNPSLCLLCVGLCCMRFHFSTLRCFLFGHWLRLRNASCQKKRKISLPAVSESFLMPLVEILTRIFVRSAVRVKHIAKTLLVSHDKKRDLRNRVCFFYIIFPGSLENIEGHSAAREQAAFWCFLISATFASVCHNFGVRQEDQNFPLAVLRYE